MTSIWALLVMGIVSAFNFGVIIRKYRLKRYFDTLVDFSIMVIICILFAGTFSALAVGMVASMAVSIYLYFNPLTLKEVIPVSKDADDWDDEDD